MLEQHADSHLDHAITARQLDAVFAIFHAKDAFFIGTIALPPELGTVPCGLYGPIMGDPPVLEHEITYACRGSRAYTSRLVDRPMRPTHIITVIAGPHDGRQCVIYTVFGGPHAPQEHGDPTCKDLAASEAFWKVHALARVLAEPHRVVRERHERDERAGPEQTPADLDELGARGERVQKDADDRGEQRNDGDHHDCRVSAPDEVERDLVDRERSP